MKPKIGRQEPTIRFALPYRETKGADAVDLYELTGGTAYDWQKIILNDILARNKDGLWTHTRFGYELPHRSLTGHDRRCRMEQPSITYVATNCEKRQIGSRGGFSHQNICAFS